MEMEINLAVWITCWGLNDDALIQQLLDKRLNNPQA